MRVGIDVSSLVQTGAGTARHVRGLLAAVEGAPELELRRLTFGGGGRAATVARDVAWYPFGIARTGPLPVTRRDHQLRVFAGADVGSKHVRRRTFGVRAEFEKERAATVVQPQFGTAHGVPRRLLIGHQDEQDRRAGAAPPPRPARPRRSATPARRCWWWCSWPAETTD